MDSGDIAWMLTSTALVVFMVPGLALFYGGMVRSKNVLNMLMMNMYCIGIVPVVWVLVSYSIGNSPDGDGFFGGDWIGNFDFVGLKGMAGDTEGLVFVAFLMTFASITPALISGAVADRLKFSAWILFVPVWLVLVYSPVTYWVYSGWQHGNGALDFAGGTAMLWFGWFGFNAGSAGAANGQAVQALLNTFLAAAAGMVGWMAAEKLRDGQVTSLGAASGVVAALVAITPAAGYVGGLAGIVFGLVAGIVCYLALTLKTRFGFDDSLDVVGIHGVGGILGGLLLGLFADASAIPGGRFDDGLFFGGGIELFLDQAVAIGSVVVFSFTVTWVIVKVLDAVVGLRVDEETELAGLDQRVHAESAYN